MSKSIISKILHHFEICTYEPDEAPELDHNPRLTKDIPIELAKKIAEENKDACENRRSSWL